MVCTLHDFFLVCVLQFWAWYNGLLFTKASYLIKIYRGYFLVIYKSVVGKQVCSLIEKGANHPCPRGAHSLAGEADMLAYMDDFRTCPVDLSMARSEGQSVHSAQSGSLGGPACGLRVPLWLTEDLEPVSGLGGGSMEFQMSPPTRTLRFSLPRKEWVESGKKGRANFSSEFFSLLIQSSCFKSIDFCCCVFLNHRASLSSEGAAGGQIYLRW